MTIPFTVKKEKSKVPLFWKFTIGMVVVVALFGSINVALVHRIIFSSLEDELQQRSIFISQVISQRAINYMLFDDVVAMNVLLDEVKAADETIEYILICDQDCLIRAHTFDGPVPSGLYDVHERQMSSEVLSAHVRFKDREQLIRDISIPLLDGSIGFVRVGITEENIAHTLDQATETLFGMIIVLIGISLVGTFIFSYLVTSPVKDISNIAESLDMQSIREKNVMFASRYPTKVGKVMQILPGDEIDILVSKFNEMVFRLQQAYDELAGAQKKLIHSEKLASIGTLAAGVAHEVNNPLAGIMNCISRMKKNPENHLENQKYLEMMEEATAKVEWVIKNLLNFARQPASEKSTIDIKQALNKSISLSSHRLEKISIKINLETPAEETFVYGSQNHLEQVFLNLILNSIDAIAEKQQQPQGEKGKISITVSRLSDLSSILMEFKDNGIGIPGENLDKVIDPFFTTKSVGKGTGLGLSVSLNIINDHGGELEIFSEHKKGTTINIILPLAQENESRQS